MVNGNFFGQPPFMQDFASYRDDRHIEVSQDPSAEWVLDIPSVLMGILVGIFVAIIGFKVSEYRAAQTTLIEAPIVEGIESTPIQLDFYEALKTYEVSPRSSSYD